MSRDEQQVARRDDLVLGELVTVLLGGDQPGDQVVAWSRAPLLDETVHVFAQPLACRQALLGGVGRLAGEGAERVERLRQQGRRLTELGLVLEWHTQQSADHRDGKRMGQIGDHVEWSSRCHVIE